MGAAISQRQPDRALALFREATKAQDLTERLFKRSQKAGAVRGDAVVEDLANVFEQLTAIRGESERRTAQLRKRYLTLQLDGLHAPARSPLPGPPPTAEEQHARWR